MALFESRGGSSSQLLDAELSGLDALGRTLPPKPRRAAKLWAAAWPKLLAVAIALLAWQVVVWVHWKPEYALPAPATVFRTFFDNFGDIAQATLTTMRRAVVDYGVAVAVGLVIGGLVAQVRVLRAAFGSLITGLQTMPSIAWFPLAILLFKQTEGTILFVVLLGAVPSIANGLISGIDHIPPVLLRAGRVLGARRLSAFRHVVLPAALPSFVAGLKQGWAFAWRSLLAGELLVQITGHQSLGQRLVEERNVNDAPGLIAVIIAILIIGIVVDAFVFAAAERAIRKRYGLIDEAATA